MRRVGRNRTKNTRLLTGWTPIGSGIYFVPTNAADIDIVRLATGGAVKDGKVVGGKKSMRLGPRHDHNACALTYTEKIVRARADRDEAVPGTIGELVFLGFRDILPTIENKDTRTERTRHWNALKAQHGSKPYARSIHEAAMRPRHFFTALNVQKHIDDSEETRPVSANREIDSWALLFHWARNRWGLTEYNPCVGIDKNDEEPRDVLPEHDALYKGTVAEDGTMPRGIYRQLDPPARFILNMYRYYGRRRGETLRLMLSDVEHADGVHMLRGKERQRRGSKKKGPRKPRVLIIPWDIRLRRMVERVLRWRAKVLRPTRKNGTERKLPAAIAATLLVGRYGAPYSKEAAKSAWRRGMMRSGQLGQFTQHDVRALRAHTLPEKIAEEVLALEGTGMLRTVYRNRGPKVIDLKGHK